MNLLVVIATGAVVGLLLGAGIYFEPKEPYKLEILIASTIRCTLVSLLTGFSLSPQSAWYAGLGYGLLYGLLSGLVIFFAKGGFRSKDTPYVVPGSAVTGALIGLIIVNYGF